MSFRNTMSDAFIGLRRNTSMAISLIVTLTVSLVLAGLGLLMQSQADRTEKYFGEQLQLQVTMCTASSLGANCVSGAASDQQLQAVRSALGNHPEVKDFDIRTPEQNYQMAQEYLGQTETGRKQLSTLSADDFFESYFVTLYRPQEYERVVADISSMSGVDSVDSLRDVLGPLYELLDNLRFAAIAIALVLIVAAVLQVTNTIRMTAMIRSREISIMRLVGASQWNIQLPFVLEAMVAALISAILASLGLAAFMYFVVYGYLRTTLGQITTWVGWTDSYLIMGYMTVLALILAVIPTLLITRKYLQV